MAKIILTSDSTSDLSLELKEKVKNNFAHVDFFTIFAPLNHEM